MEINLSRDIIYRIVDRAKEFHSKEGVVIPEDTNEISEDDFNQILANHQNDLTYREAKKEIDHLEPDQQITLVALMYLGRGDFSLDEWDICLEEATRGWTKHTGRYLLSKPYIASYLLEGLHILGFDDETE